MKEDTPLKAYLDVTLRHICQDRRWRHNNNFVDLSLTILRELGKFFSVEKDFVHEEFKFNTYIKKLCLKESRNVDDACLQDWWSLKKTSRGR